MIGFLFVEVTIMAKAARFEAVGDNGICKGLRVHDQYGLGGEVVAASRNAVVVHMDYQARTIVVKPSEIRVRSEQRFLSDSAAAVAARQAEIAATTSDPDVARRTSANAAIFSRLSAAHARAAKHGTAIVSALHKLPL